MKAVFRRMGAVVVAAILSLALAGCGQEVAKETIAVRIDGEAAPFLFRSRTVTQTTDIWEVLPVYGELEDAAPSVQPGEHRVGIDFSGCAFPERIAAYGYRGGSGVSEDGVFEERYGAVAIDSCEQTEDTFTLRFTAQASAHADEMAVFVFYMEWPAGGGAVQEAWLYVGCFAGQASAA